MILSNGMTMLAALTATREMLAKCWIRGMTEDGRGGHCHAGCFNRVVQLPEVIGFSRQYQRLVGSHPAAEYLNDLAEEMHPHLAGNKTDGLEFNESPSVYVNDVLGKAAILAVYDEAIRRLRPPADDEVNALCNAVAAEEMVQV